jgi:hypothetical protein
MAKEKTCHDCGAKEGQIHDLGCDMEYCPFCGGQLISCECVYNLLGLRDTQKYGLETSYLSHEIYNNGLTDPQEEKWLGLLEEKGRTPYIRWPNMCARCGKLWPEMFSVPDAEWEKYIQKSERHQVLCRPCYDEIKELIDTAGHRKVEAV